MNFVRNRKAVSASRASLNGIAGHQAAMKAIGNQLSGKSRDRMSSEDIAKQSVQKSSPSAVDIDIPTRVKSWANPKRSILVDNSPESKMRVTHSIDNLAAKYAEEGPL